MRTSAIVFAGPEQLALRSLPLPELGPGELLVKIEFSAISTGTERLLWSGRMPAFPGLGYPLVPGYESVGRVLERAGDVDPALGPGSRVFVPGADCYGEVRGLFGGAASHVVVSAARVTHLDAELGLDEPDDPAQGVLLALLATAEHALRGGAPPDLIVGHGVLGRLLARLALSAGASPVVWERDCARAGGASGYRVVHPDEDSRRDYGCIYDVSGDAALLDTLIARLSRGGEIVLAGFYAQPLSFAFPPAFMREARLRVAAEWQPADLSRACERLRRRELSLSGLVTHRAAVRDAAGAYRTAFTDPACLKMLIDWRDPS